MTRLPVDLRILDPRLPAWGFPHRGSALAAGLDLHACLDAPLVLAPGGPAVLVPAGFAIRIGDPAWCAVLAPRSGLGHRGLVLGNGIGVIDADYEGEIRVSCWNRNPADPSLSDGGALTIAPGDRIAQLVFLPVGRPDFRLVDAVPGSEGRGEGGFGSTGIGPLAPS